MDKYVSFKKTTNINNTIIRLLGKLNLPTDSLLSDIHKNFVSIIEVYYDEKFYGILLVRGERYHTGDLCMVIDHAIAEDKIDEHFSSILKQSLWKWVATQEFQGQKFNMVKQVADSEGLKRMLESYYGKPSMYIFEKKLWHKNQETQTVPQARQQQATRQA